MRKRIGILAASVFVGRDALRRVTANRPIKGTGVPIMSFGEDAAGEAYVMGVTNNGRGILEFVPKK